MSDAEYLAATRAVAWFDGCEREVLRVTGPDAGSFLHGMVTNDVLGLAVGASCYAAMLTPKGGMVTDVRVLRRSDDYVIDVAPSRGELAKAFLQKYLISEDAEVHDAREFTVVSFIGPDSRAAASLLDGLGEFISLLGGVDVIIERGHAPLSGVQRITRQTWDIIRVERGVPAFGIDMTETTIPMEARIDHAIHHKKGRYIGHEIIVRATFRGRVNKNLMTLWLGDSMPARGAELKAGERKVGWLTSVVHSPRAQQNVALGYVHRDFQMPGTEFDVIDSGGEHGTARARVAAPT